MEDYKHSNLWWWTVIQLIFIILKGLNELDWSWWAVLIPLWLAIGINVVLFVVLFVVTLIKAFYEA